MHSYIFFLQVFPFQWDRDEWDFFPVAENQSSTGYPSNTCWVFSGISSVEYAIQKFKKFKVKLSEQLIVDSFPMNKDTGGHMNEVFDYAIKYGLSTAEDYPNVVKNKHYKV